VPNKHLQTTLIEAAKVATRWHPELALLYEREKQKANRNRGTLAVARKIVAYLLAVDRSKRNFEPRCEYQFQLKRRTTKRVGVVQRDLPDFARSRAGQGRNSEASLLVVSRPADESKLNLR